MLSQRYYYELEFRENIFNRLQLNFAIYASIIALIAYMVRMLDYGSSCVAITLFFVGLFAGAVLLIWSIFHSVTALTGYEYKTLPKSVELITYENDLQQHAKALEDYNSKYNQTAEIPNIKILLNKYIDEDYSKCIDHNYTINEYRKQAVRKSIWRMVTALIPIALSVFLFVSFDLDVSSPRKVSASFSDGKPLIKALDNVHKSISEIVTKDTQKEKTKMSNENDQSNAPQSHDAPPPPPQEPQRPQLQTSTEDFKGPMPDKSQILTEEKKS